MAASYIILAIIHAAQAYPLLKLLHVMIRSSYVRLDNLSIPKYSQDFAPETCVDIMESAWLYLDIV